MHKIIDLDWHPDAVISRTVEQPIPDFCPIFILTDVEHQKIKS